MLGHLLLKSSKLFTTQRWNNMSRFETTTFADSSWFSTLVAFILARIEENMYAKKVDQELLLKRCVFHKLPTCIVGNISSSIKESPDLRQSLNEVIEIAVKDELAPLAPVTTQAEFTRCILQAKDESIEGRIVMAADLLTSLLECESELSLGIKDFQEPQEIILKKLGKIDLKSINIILTDTLLKKFLRISRRLSNTERWNTEVRRFPTNVAGHSWYTALLCYFLVNWEDYKFGNKINITEVIKKAVFHDLAEAVTGDIINPTKKRSDKLNSALSKVEAIKIREELIAYLPSYLQDECTQLITQAKDSTKEGQILHAADMITAMLECVFEIQKGNKNPFRSNYFHIKRLVNLQSFDSVNYFLIWSLDDFWEEVRYK